MVGDGVDKTLAKVNNLNDVKAFPDAMGVGELNKGLGKTQDMLGNMGTALPKDIFASNITGGVSAQMPDTKAQKGLEGVSGGGARPTTVNISIGNLNEKIEVYTTNLQQGTAEIEAMLLQLLMRVVNGANQMGQ